MKRSVSFPCDPAVRQRIRARMVARQVSEWRRMAVMTQGETQKMPMMVQRETQRKPLVSQEDRQQVLSNHLQKINIMLKAVRFRI